jgi:hypothetical protein
VLLGHSQRSTPNLASLLRRPFARFQQRVGHQNYQLERQLRRISRLGYQTLSACTNNSGSSSRQGTALPQHIPATTATNRQLPYPPNHTSRRRTTHRSHKPRVVMHQPHARHTNAPPNHNKRQKDTRSQLLQQHVGQRLEDGVADKEDG